MKQTGKIGVGGGELHYRAAGTGEPLLLVHGAGPDSRAWSPTFEQLASTHRVVAYDRRGYGQSSPPSGAGWKSHGDDAVAVIEQLGLAPATVVGWSAGGYVALYLATERPDLVRNLVLAETGLPLPPVATASYLLAFAKVQVLGRARGHRAAADLFLRWVMKENGTSTWDRSDYPDDRRHSNLGNADGMWADLDPGGRPDLSRKALAKVRCPVTLIVGDSGQRWFPKSADALAGLLPDTQIRTVEGTNHAFTFHQPERFAAAILEAARR